MYGILGEDISDVKTLKVLVKRLAGDNALRVGYRGYDGCSEMLRKGAKQLAFFRDLGHTRFIVCHDADGPDPAPKRNLVMREIVKPSGLASSCCILVPVQELEAWILADIECAANIFPGWKPAAIPNPEGVRRPKEYVEKLSRDSKQKPHYRHATHNERMASYLDLDMVAAKCPAFRELRDFVWQAKRPRSRRSNGRT